MAKLNKKQVKELDNIADVIKLSDTSGILYEIAKIMIQYHGEYKTMLNDKPTIIR